MSRRRKSDSEDTEKPVFRLAALFIPPGDDTKAQTDDFIAFTEIVTRAKDIERRKRTRELKAKDRNLRKVLRDFEETHPELPEPFQVFFDDMKKPPASLRGDELIVSRANWQKVHSFLFAKSEEGDPDAIEFLHDVAGTSTLLLMMAERLHPEIARKISRTSAFWPVLATTEPDWPTKAKGLLGRLELGQGAAIIRCQFYQAAGADENNPARLWAKEAVRTIEQTIWRTITCATHDSTITDLVLNGKIEFPIEPKWYSLLSPITPFSTETLPQWSKLVRSLISESVPEIHLRKEWKNTRNSLKERDLDTPGRIRAAILNDICSALKTIAPRHSLPKSAS